MSFRLLMLSLKGPSLGIRRFLETFFWKKINLSAKLLGAKKALAKTPFQRLIDIHKFLLGEMEQILALEEELWGMKANKTNWLI